MVVSNCSQGLGEVFVVRIITRTVQCTSFTLGLHRTAALAGLHLSVPFLLHALTPGATDALSLLHLSSAAKSIHLIHTACAQAGQDISDRANQAYKDTKSAASDEADKVWGTCVRDTCSATPPVLERVIVHVEADCPG